MGKIGKRVGVEEGRGREGGGERGGMGKGRAEI